jgi:hypothetical protein
VGASRPRPEGRGEAESSFMAHQHESKPEPACSVFFVSGEGDSSFQPIQRAVDTMPAFAQGVGVDHGCFNIRVPKQFLHSTNI